MTNYLFYILFITNVLIVSYPLKSQIKDTVEFEDPGSSPRDWEPPEGKSFRLIKARCDPKRIPIPKYLKGFKGHIIAYLRFKKESCCFIKDIYITRVNLKGEKRNLYFHMDSKTSSKIWTSDFIDIKINYPSDVEKILPYIKKYVNCMEFYLEDSSKQPYGNSHPISIRIKE